MIELALASGIGPMEWFAAGDRAIVTARKMLLDLRAEGDDEGR